MNTIEKCLLPFPDRVVWNQGHPQQVSLTTYEKVRDVSSKTLNFFAHLICLPLVLAYSLASRAVAWFRPAPANAVEEPGQADAAALPPHFGFADSLFQTSGLGTEASATPLPSSGDWNRWLHPERIEGTAEGDYQKFFVDILRNPEPFIQILREMHVTAHRFSLEWSVIEPEEGHYNLEALHLYTRFIRQLKNNGIEPYVTLHHFTCPAWFEKKGGFTKLENVEIYRHFALNMMEHFRSVQNWMPFNEINVDAFQKYVRGVYPPGKEGDIAAAGRAMRHMLLAHCEVYQAAKARWPELQIGSSHQWLKFEPLEGNPLERLICYFLSKITHYACYNFFKTGQFSLEIPGMANVQFSMPKEEWERNRGFSDFIGVQCYGFPRLKAGWGGGEEYPGYRVVNRFGWTFGSTCPKGGEMMSFGLSFYPESLEACLKEAAELGKPIVISETGCDAKIQKWGEKTFQINDETQRRYFERILPILGKFQAQLKAFFAWTVVRRHLEWDRGEAPCLGLVEVLKDRNRHIVGHRLSPAALWLQNIYREAVARIRQAA